VTPLSGNLSVRSLADVVHREDFADPSSEFLTTLLVAVPKNLSKDWLTNYERLTSMVVPRSSRQIAKDDEYVLYNVTVFKKVQEEFRQKCREKKWTVREFQWDDGAVEKQKEELETAGQSEKELWVRTSSLKSSGRSIELTRICVALFRLSSCAYRAQISQRRTRP